MSHYQDQYDREFAREEERKKERLKTKVKNLKFLIDEYGLEEAIIRYVEYDEA